MIDLTPEMIAAFNRYAAHRDTLDRYGYQGATTADRRKYTRLLNKALDAAQKGTTGIEDPVFRKRWSELSNRFEGLQTNPRPRKYASASERQAAYRDRAPEVCFRAEPKTVETLDRIADTIDRSRAELLLSMTKFALTNHDWERFGLTHKTLPRYEGNPIMTETLIYGLPRGQRERFAEALLYGGGLKLSKDQIERVKAAASADGWHSFRVVDFDPTAKPDFSKAVKRNPMKTTRAKRTPTPAQLAARERFAEMARAGSFKKAGGRKANPVGNDRRRAAAEAVREATVQRTNANSAMVWQIIGPGGEVVSGPPGVYPGREGPLAGSATMGNRGWKTKREASAALAQLNRKADEILGVKSNSARKAAGVKSNPAPAKQRMGRIVRVDPKTGVPFGTELVPIDFAFKEYIGNYQQDFFARTEGAQLVVSEKTTGAKVGAVPFTLRSAALNDRAAAKAFVQKTVEKVGADRFNDAIRKAPKLTA